MSTRRQNTCTLSGLPARLQGCDVGIGHTVHVSKFVYNHFWSAHYVWSDQRFTKSFGTGKQALSYNMTMLSTTSRLETRPARGSWNCSPPPLPPPPPCWKDDLSDVDDETAPLPVPSVATDFRVVAPAASPASRS